MNREVIDGLAVGRSEGSDETRIIYVHGILDRGATFLNVARRIEGPSWLIYDRRGYGRSVTDIVPTFDDHVSDLVGLILSESELGPTVLVGHSLGGTIALSAASSTPEAVAAIIVHEPPAPWLEWWPVRDDRGRRIEDEESADAVARMMTRIAGPDVWDRLPEAVRSQRLAEGPIVVSELVGARHECNGDLSRLSMPVVVTRSASSTGHRERAQAWFLDALPDGRGHVFDDGGHNIQATHPRDVAAIVASVSEWVKDSSPS